MPPYHHGALPASLLEGAETILERDGIGALTLRGAAREAGVSHAAPAHHFGDLRGLLTALAASGFVRLHHCLGAAVSAISGNESARLPALGRGYVEFARASPALFQLMFRSERLDWSDPALSGAGAATFALLAGAKTGGGTETDDPFAGQGLQDLATATARWSLTHGLSMLLIDGRLQAMADKAPGVELESLVEQVLARLARPEPAPGLPGLPRLTVASASISSR